MKRRSIFSWALAPAILALAWPTMLEQFLQTAVQYIDTAMVGSLGTAATAAVGATTTVNWLIGSTVSALGVGFLAIIAQAHGAGDLQRMRRTAAQSVFMTLICGTFFTVLTLSLSPFIPAWMQVDPALRETASRYFFILYLPMLFRTASILFGTVLRAAGETKAPMRVGLLVNAVNVVLNFFLIYPTRQASVFGLQMQIPGAGLGVTGAAIASAAAFTVGGVGLTVKLFRHESVSPVGQSIKPDGTILLPCLKIAFPNALQRFGTSLGYVFFASMVNALGETATAAHTLANTVESAFYVPGYGMMTAAATLAGRAYGADDKEKILSLARMIILIETGMMLVSGALLFAFAPQLLTLFSKDAKVIALGAAVLRMVSVSEPFYGVSIVIEGMMQGMGNTRLPFVCSISTMWGVRIVGTFLCTAVFGMGLTAAWGCMIAHNLCLFVLFTGFYLHRRYFFGEKMRKTKQESMKVS